MSEPASQRTTVRRAPKRAVYDRASIDEILDEALYCHLGFVHDGQPYVIPTIHARTGDRLYVHGSSASRMLTLLGAGAPVCATVTLLDGIVLARSVFNHSMNYRSVVVLGSAATVEDEDEKRAALDAIVERVVPGRTRDARPPTDTELRATTVMWLPLDEASAKVRSGGPLDPEDDVALPVWAGVIPLETHARAPIVDPRTPSGIPTPPYVLAYAERVRRSAGR